MMYFCRISLQTAFKPKKNDVLLQAVGKVKRRSESRPKAVLEKPFID